MTDYDDAMCITALREEIERLRSNNKANEGLIYGMRKRIEELEKEKAAWKAEAISRAGGAVHGITDEQIDAAAEYANWSAEADPWKVLDKLGIERCDGCYSCMEKDTPAARNRPDCNGHGWVKK
ncbi:unnamed protein product [marine sediment metagenome]|uniref:Uncharacterized protein n=1 Tax=marine sediment metagenome TaxID=412755 RepID=X1TN20_9ZZZZ